MLLGSCPWPLVFWGVGFEGFGFMCVIYDIGIYDIFGIHDIYVVYDMYDIYIDILYTYICVKYDVYGIYDLYVVFDIYDISDTYDIYGIYVIK